MEQTISSPVRLTDEQSAELIRLKSYFPYRVVFGVLHPDGTFEVYAKHDKRLRNKFCRMPGYSVFSFNP